MPNDTTLQSVRSADDILETYRGTRIGDLLAAHNLGTDASVTDPADVVIVTCMDYRIDLRLPDRFAFQLRTAGATPEPVLANLAFAVSVAGVRTIAVIGHTDCAMCRAESGMEAMATHLTTQEHWTPGAARDARHTITQTFEISDPVPATIAYARRLATLFPSCLVAPLLYQVEDDAVVQIDVDVSAP